MINIWRVLKSRMTFFAGMSYKSFGERTVIDRAFRIKGKKHISIGEKTYIRSGIRLEAIPEQNQRSAEPEIIIGSHVQIHYNCTIIAAGNGKVSIGDYCLLASNIYIGNDNHGMNPDVPSYILNPLITKDIYIGEGCWLGEKVVILPGVHIGNKSIIGAGSVVTKNIPAYSIAVGNPARVVKQYDQRRKEWVKIL